MKEVELFSENINKSLVFYRSLFGRMPDEMDAWSLMYCLGHFSVRIRESAIHPLPDQVFTYPVMERSKLQELNSRMRRFAGKVSMNNRCTRFSDAFGLMDPDGHKWVVGNPQTRVYFDQCYS